MVMRNLSLVKSDSDWSPSSDAFIRIGMRALAAMERDGRGRSPEIPRERLLYAVWAMCYTGMQWRMLGQCLGLKWQTVYAWFEQMCRRNLWRAIGLALTAAVRRMLGCDPDPTVGVVDSRTVSSTPTCGLHGIDGGKKRKGIKLNILVEKHGFPLGMDVMSAGVNDRGGLRRMLSKLTAAWPDVAVILGDLGYSGAPLAKDAAQHGIHLKTTKCGANGKFIPCEIRWVVERTFAWLSRWRRLAVCYERDVVHYEAFAWIAMSSIMANHISKLVAHPNRIARMTDIPLLAAA
jgi:putative transposase